jgi:hypothetical protein
MPSSRIVRSSGTGCRMSAPVARSALTTKSNGVFTFAR